MPLLYWYFGFFTIFFALLPLTLIRFRFLAMSCHWLLITWCHYIFCHVFARRYAGDYALIQRCWCWYYADDITCLRRHTYTPLLRRWGWLPHYAPIAITLAIRWLSASCRHTIAAAAPSPFRYDALSVDRLPILRHCRHMLPGCCQPLPLLASWPCLAVCCCRWLRHYAATPL